MTHSIANYLELQKAEESLKNCLLITSNSVSTPFINRLHAEIVSTISSTATCLSASESLMRFFVYSYCDLCSSSSDAYSCSISVLISKLEKYLLSLTNIQMSSDTPSLDTDDHDYSFFNNPAHDSLSSSPLLLPQSFMIQRVPSVTSLTLNDSEYPLLDRDVSLDLPEYLPEDTQDNKTMQVVLPPYPPSSDNQLNKISNDSIKKEHHNEVPKTRKRVKKDDDEPYYDDTSASVDTTLLKRRGRPRKSIESMKSEGDAYSFHTKPKWCHQCKARKKDVIQCCGEGKPRGANHQICYRAYCSKCLKKHYDEDLNDIRKKAKKWLCPGCRDACSCAACVRKRYTDPRDIPEKLRMKRNSRFFKTNTKLLSDLLSYSCCLPQTIQISTD